MRDLDDLLVRIGAVLDQPDLPPLDLDPIAPDEPILGARLVRFWADEAVADWPPVLPSGRHGCDPVPVEYRHDPTALWHAEHGGEPAAEKPRPRPPRPFPSAESDALRHRAESDARAGLDAKAERLARDLAPRPWWGRWRRRG